MSDSGGAGVVRWALRVGLVAGGAVATTAVRRRVAARSAGRPSDDSPAELPSAPEQLLGSVHRTPTTVVTSDGVGLRVEIEDATDDPGAPTIVFVPGFCLNMNVWHFQRLDLRGSVRCVFYDQRGHGDTEWSRELDYSMEAMADDALAFVAGLQRKFGPTRASLMHRRAERRADRDQGRHR